MFHAFFCISSFDSLIVCLAPAGVGSNHDVVVSLDEVQPSNSVLFSYDKPDVLCAGCGFQPNLMDAAGGKIVICGRNFGSSPPSGDEPPITVQIDEKQCDKVTWARDSYTCGNKPHISCVTAPSVVGQKNVTIAVGGQSSFWPAADGVYGTRCRYESYGKPGELCLDCTDPKVFGAEDAALCKDKDNGLWGTIINRFVLS
jgi:hypothetical protein